METCDLQQAQAFCRILAETVGKLPAEVRGRLYRPAAENCVKGTALTGAVGRTKKPEV
ncbi:hypothetical protein [Alistipes shahii]|uniref:hypothetical protein n=1 Tax=Alistipes shahii TaxID=328814 RepID=UPI00266C7AF8|nr:hypothetical protein [Alistipes shahii]